MKKQNKNMNERSTEEVHLATEIEHHPELKESLLRIINNREMKKYTKDDLLKIRSAKRIR